MALEAMACHYQPVLYYWAVVITAEISMNQIVPYIFYLSCPISMGGMMWFMMRGMQGGRAGQKPPDSRIDALEREVQALHAVQREREHVEMK
jgi:hypothetical protein